jgi:hypothetical protein
MNDSIVGRLRPTWPRTVRTAVAMIAAAGLAMLAAACGGSPGSHVAQLGSTPKQTGSSPSNASAASASNDPLAFSSCMRSHGVPTYPDPNSSGQLVKKTPQELGVSSSQFQAAQSHCQHLLPNGGSGPSQAYVRQLIAREVRVSRCMRAHGVMNFPDPGSDGHFPDAILHRIEAQNSPKFQAANKVCWQLGAPPTTQSGP